MAAEIIHSMMQQLTYIVKNRGTIVCKMPTSICWSKSACAMRICLRCAALEALVVNDQI